MPKFDFMTTVNQLDLKNQKAIIRVDFNVPLNDDRQVTDNTRIVAAKPTIDAVLSAGGSCILMSHLGRPKGVTPDRSLQHIIPAVEEVLGHKVIFAQDSIGEEAQSKAAALKPGEILLLENLRFHAEETAGDETFAKSLAGLADV